MTALVLPSLDLYDSWAATVGEFEGGHVDGASIPDEEAADTSREACERLIENTARDRDVSVPPPAGRVHASAFWITDDGDVVGFIQLRHELNEFLENVGGHIGYSVRPSSRRQGHARRALGMLLAEARALGLERVLITCDEDNAASARTIESQGGQLQDVFDGAAYGTGPKRRYWIKL
ncbi:GNAT family N-acetyltransferase [Nocardioides albus]|uniref:Putative acetyltransferase n=1 Tax=Nocardioides albus TaxID=1841 RepID=A0A7W5FBK0_9ACTN|nr:GNAT family N-acetyltransferase [Nocardioides albus]MBB3092290.1 putative acetyltransferase [Nocardioides albus]GGU26364.1 acetyltransferase [Nocardioides albus]